MLIRLALLAVIAALVATPVRARQQRLPTAAELAPQVEALMARFMADAKNVGVSVGVTRGQDTLVLGGWGLADRAAGLKATPETTYRLGSTSKQFTAALVMRLVERKAVALEDLVEKHLPDMPSKWRGITVTQLLNHTSGVPDYTATGSGHWPKTYTPQGLLGIVGDDSLHFAPGSKYEYSNSNYVMLALIAEKSYGKPLRRILDDEIVKPLGLATTRFCEDAYGANGQARPYVRDDAKIVDAPYRSVSHSFGAGGVCSTVADVAAWNRALHGGKVVNAESYKLMTTPQGAAVGERYGFGLQVRPIAGRNALYHGGLVPGFISVNGWLPSESLSVTIVTNTSPTPQLAFLYRDLVRLSLGLPVSIVTPIEGAAPDAAALRKYTGTFTIQLPGRTLDIRFRVDGRVLKGQATGQTETELRLVGQDSFGSDADWTARFTFIFEGGVATKLKFEQGGQAFDAVRKR